MKLVAGCMLRYVFSHAWLHVEVTCLHVEINRSVEVIYLFVLDDTMCVATGIYCNMF